MGAPFTDIFSESVPIGDLLVRAAVKYPERTAVAFPDSRVTYRDFLHRVLGVAKSLVGLGVQPRDKIGILMLNSQECADAIFAASLIGCVLVPLNGRFRSRELGYVIEHAELRVLLCSERGAQRTDFRRILGESLPSILTMSASEPLNIPEAALLRHIVMVDGEGSAGIMGQSDFAARANSINIEFVDQLRHRVANRDVAMILYTSGTTAYPKGCLLTHEALSRGSVARMREVIPLKGDDVFWCGNPLFHVAAMQVMIASVGLGATFVTDYFFDAGRAVQQVREQGVTSFWPFFQPLVVAMAQTPQFDPARDFASVTSFAVIGAPDFLKATQRMMPQAVHISGAGMSEMAGYFSMPALTEANDVRADNAGTPISGIEVRVIDPESGLDTPPGHRGELLVRGYLRMNGYFRDAPKTHEAIDEAGWFHTGDLFTLDAQGRTRFQGRLKDMLKVGGENVPAVELEAFLCTHPSVGVAEVVGRPDQRLEEVPVAFVELVHGTTLNEQELIDFCKGRIASFKVPRAIYFKTAEEWPMSATKVNKIALREEAKQRMPQ